MGKQINYYMEFNDFRQLVQYALDELLELHVDNGYKLIA